MKYTSKSYQSKRWGSTFWNKAVRAIGVLSFLGCIVAVSAGDAEADLVAQLKSFSAFTEVDLSALASGEILTQRGSLMKFRRGISGESCYVVMKPSSTTEKFIETSDPSQSNEEGFSFHRQIQLPLRDEEFAGFKFKTERFSIRRLIDQTMAVTANKANFAMSRAEAAEMEKTIKGATRGGMPPADIVRTCWINLVKGRAAQFHQSGLAQLSPYEMKGRAINPTSEIRSLLGEHVKIAKEFAVLLQETGLVESSSGRRIAPSVNYCELLNWDLQSTFDLGALFTRDLGNGRYQLVDCQYYSSGIFYVSVCFFELWPVKIDGKEATLVWNAYLLAAPVLEVTRGIERVAYGTIMMVEIKKSIRNFKKDIAPMQ